MRLDDIRHLFGYDRWGTRKFLAVLDDVFYAGEINAGSRVSDPLDWRDRHRGGRGGPTEGGSAPRRL